jgi:hypothetical protein
MAASPVSIVPVPTSGVRRRSIVLSQRRLEANRRNAARSSGPRTGEGKAKVARNAIKHGFFAAPERWTPKQHRDFEETLDGLREDFQPDGVLEENCVRTIADSYVRMAAVLRYENIAALKYHQHQERELNERIASADAPEAAHLRAEREQLRRAGLWRPTIPGPREAMAIVRYSGSLDRAIRRAASELKGLQNVRICGASSGSKTQKQTHSSASPRSGHEAAEGPRMTSSPSQKTQKQTHYNASPPIHENAKTNPLSSMFTGNRHQRRRAKALAARRR